MASVAQSVEHRTVDAAVAGSSPVARPKKTGLWAGFVLLRRMQDPVLVEFFYTLNSGSCILLLISVFLGSRIQDNFSD